MINGIYDSHAHYTSREFDEDREAVIEMLRQNGVVGVIDIGCNLEIAERSIALAHRYPDFFRATVGIHPEDANSLPGNWLERLEGLAQDEFVVGIGEIGLDYHYDDAPTREEQKAVFEAQLELASRLEYPVSIHSRDAAEDTILLLRKHKPRGVVHCFSGSVETAKEVLGLGMSIGFTGVVTFPNAKKAKEVAQMVPIDRLLLETDCPYMAPVPYRGKRTTSDMIAHTAAAIAELRGVSTQEIVDAARENTKRLFGIQ